MTFGGECIVLLHGLARTTRSMSDLGQFFQANGYHVVNQAYPSRKNPIQELARTAIPRAIERCRDLGANRIHFVTHSMGGILVRYYLNRRHLPELGRIVMISPPNQGSQVVDRLGKVPLFNWINGPAGRQLGTDQASLPKCLGAPDCDIGVIAGDRSINIILSQLIPGRNDGKVAVENTRLPGMRDFIVVHKPHPFIMKDPYVWKQAMSFLKSGRFDRA